GVDALSDGTHGVNIVNHGLFDVLNGNQQVGNVTSDGSLIVEHDAALTAQSITASTLTIGAGATVTILPIPGGPLAGLTSLTVVPEPSTLVLLSLAALAGLFRMYFRIKR
ncbi:MAG: PEP-CTERM sorting domain-containing protein, partial [Thermoguttaceae bacterium]